MEHNDKTPKKAADAHVQKFGVPKTRERVLEALSAAYIDQQLETDEYEKRIELAYQARTLDELEQTVYDFPNRDSIMQQEPRPFVGGGAQGVPQMTLIGDRTLTHLDFGAQPLQAFQLIGDFTVDLRNVPDGSLLELQAFSLIGDMKVLVPAGMTVEQRNLMTLIGEVRRRKKREMVKMFKKWFGKAEESEADVQRRDPTNAVLRLKGFKLIGDITIIDC